MSFEKERYIVFVIAVSILAFWLSAEGQAEELLFLCFALATRKFGLSYADRMRRLCLVLAAIIGIIGFRFCLFWRAGQLQRHLPGVILTDTLETDTGLYHYIDPKTGKKAFGSISKDAFALPAPDARQSKNGDFIVYKQKGGFLCVKQASTGRTWTGYGVWHTLNDYSISPDGRYVAYTYVSGYNRYGLRVWEYQTGIIMNITQFGYDYPSGIYWLPEDMDLAVIKTKNTAQ